MAAAVAAVVAASCSAADHRAPTTTGRGSAPKAARPTGPPTGGPTPAPTGAPTTAPTVLRTLQAVLEPWSLPAAVSRPVVLPDGSGFVILGGLATGDVSTSRIVAVDPGSGHAQVAGRLAVAVHDSAGAVLGGRWFVFGGGSFSTVSDIQAWTAGAATVLGNLPAARSDLTVATSGATAYILGGFDGTAMTPQVLATTDGVTFRPVGDLPVPVRYAAAGVVGGTLWVIGGVTSTSEGGTAETDAVQSIDLTTGAARVAGRLNVPLGHAAAVVLGGQLFVVGGTSGGAPSAAIWRLDEGTGSLAPAGQLPQPRSDAGAVVVGGTAYLVGGEVTGPTAPLDTVVALRAAP